MGARAHAQQTEFSLNAEGNWIETLAPEQGTDEAVIAQADRKIAEGSPKAALRILNRWITKNSFVSSPMLPTAYRLRGDAKVAMGNEYRALFDYETVARSFPASAEFVTVLEREFEIASKYLHGMRRKWFGLRVFSAKPDGERLLFQITQRMPGSSMQERALLELGDYYFQKRELDMAREAYRVFLELFPKSEHRKIAMRRQVDASAAGFKGPAYDASGLREAKVLVELFEADYPNDASQAGLNDARIARIDESLASEKLYTAKWYLSQKDKPAARLMLRRVVRQYPGTLSAQGAYELLERYGWAVGTKPPDSTSVLDDVLEELDGVDEVTDDIEDNDASNSGEGESPKNPPTSEPATGSGDTR